MGTGMTSGQLYDLANMKAAQEKACQLRHIGFRVGTSGSIITIKSPTTPKSQLGNRLIPVSNMSVSSEFAQRAIDTHREFLKDEAAALDRYTKKPRGLHHLYARRQALARTFERMTERIEELPLSSYSVEELESAPTVSRDYV